MTDEQRRPTASIEALPMELLHRIILRHLSPLDASHLMITSHALRSALKHITLAEEHLRYYIHNHCDPDVAFPYSDTSYSARTVDWRLVKWEEGVDEVYWAAVFVEFGYFEGMMVVAKGHWHPWTEEHMGYYNHLRAFFYRLLPPYISIEWMFDRFYDADMPPASELLPPMNPRVTSALFHIAHAGLDPHPTTVFGALAHVAFFSPDRLLAYLSALPTPPLNYLPMVITLLAYVDYHSLIAEVLTQYPLPDGPGHLPHRIAASTGSLQSLRVLMEHAPADLTAHESEILRMAASYGHAHVVKFLLEYTVKPMVAHRPQDALSTALEDGHANTQPPEHSFARPSCLDPGAKDSIALRVASYRGYADVVKLLLDHSLTAKPLGIPHVDPSTEESDALRDACEEGHADVVKLLLDHSLAAAHLGIPVADPSARDSETLHKACKKGRAEIVNLLLDHSLAAKPLRIPCLDPVACGSQALRIARKNGKDDVVKVLLDHPLTASLGTPAVKAEEE
ncbi:hypothetical protein HDU96_011037 [Phlyctochytrium bullatum]|nr:hypothetical protein HDU96_011037 [Phlyctochytrium bullatum]